MYRAGIDVRGSFSFSLAFLDVIRYIDSGIRIMGETEALTSIDIH
jgi:hypothetical protein